MSQTRKIHAVATAQTVEQRRDRAFKTACIEARNLFAQGYQVRISQANATDFKVFGRKGVTR